MRRSYSDGMFSDVPPNMEHRFEALEDTKAFRNILDRLNRKTRYN